LALNALKMREKSLGQAHGGGVIRDQFLVKDVQVHSLGLREVEWSLDSRVDKDAVQIRIL
jgi:hypothetical protein